MQTASCSLTARQLDSAAAAGTLSAQLLIVESIEDGREQSEERNQPRDHEPDEERAAIHAADDPPGQPEESMTTSSPPPATDYGLTRRAS